MTRSAPLHAVVLGASIGGTAAAAALCQQGVDVVIVERDRIPPNAEPRRGVPQSAQLHNLLTAAQVNLESLCPGFLDAIVAAGAIRGRVSLDTHVFELGIQMPERDLGLELICAPRPVIEHALRELVLDHRGVRLRDCSIATDVIIRDGAVTGVEIRSDHGSTERLDADIVIDAMGPLSPVPDWLSVRAIAIDQQHKEVRQWYATALHRMPTPGPAPSRFCLVFPTPPSSRGGLASPVGIGLVNISLNGGPDDPPPRTADDFRAFARSLEDPVIAELAESLQAVGPPTVFHRLAATWNHYERCKEPVTGLLPVGDAVATLNPLFGQGISVAATQASALSTVLAGILDDGGTSLAELGTITCTYHAMAAEAVERAWALGELVEHPTGWRRSVTDHGTAVRLGRLLAEDPVLHERYVSIWHLLEPASSLDTPALLDRLSPTDPSRPHH